MCPVLRVVRTVLFFMRMQLLVYVSHPLRFIVLSSYRPLDRRALTYLLTYSMVQSPS